VVIPTYNRSSQLDRLLQQLTTLTTATLRQVIVIDNASSDETPVVVAKYPSVISYRNTENVRSARARQQGWEHSTSDYVCFIDDDNVLDDKMLDELCTFLDHHPRVGMVAPVQYRLDDRTIWCTGGRIDDRLRVTYERTLNHLDEHSTFAFQPNVFMVRNHLREEGLGFDWAHFPHNWSEAEFGHRLMKGGWEIRTCSRAVTFHDIDYRGAFTRINAANLADQSESRVRFRRMYANTPMVWIWFFVVVLPASVAALAVAVRKDAQRWAYLRTYIAATWSGLRA
jgi:GT2 family glycosyltransferase